MKGFSRDKYMLWGWLSEDAILFKKTAFLNFFVNSNNHFDVYIFQSEMQMKSDLLSKGQCLYPVHFRREVK